MKFGFNKYVVGAVLLGVALPALAMPGTVIATYLL